MADKGTSGIGGSAGWEVDHLRLTSFPKEPLDIDEVEFWWRDLTGQKKRDVNLSPEGLIEQGVVEGQQLTFKFEESRIDWLLQPVKGEDEPPRGVHSLGKLDDSLDRFLKLIEKWVDSRSPVSDRIALGTVLLHPVDNKEEGYRHLQPFLEQWVKVDPEGSSELTYSINRRRNSSVVPGLQINRLAKWFVWVWKPFRIEVRVQPRPGITQSESGEARMACRADLDINTAPEFEGSFDKPQQKDILAELRSLLLEMAAKGDVA